METDNQLSNKEKVVLLANMDARSKDEYDEKFSSVIEETPPLAPHKIDDQIRRSIARYASMVVGDDDIEKICSSNEPSVWLQMKVTISFLHGYQVAMKWGKPIVSA